MTTNLLNLAPFDSDILTPRNSGELLFHFRFLFSLRETMLGYGLSSFFLSAGWAQDA